MNKLMVIDGSALLFRAFFALPLLMTKKGIYTNAIYGFVQMMENAVDKYDPDYLAVCFDKPGGTFRHELYEDYKGTRQSTPEELSQQIPILLEILEAKRIPILASDEFEADDIAGTLAKLAEKRKWETLLVTGDKDYLQLVDTNTEVVLTRKGVKELDRYDVSRIQEEYGVEPQQLIDLKGLMGDSSDNIPGVPRVGEKTGLKLLQQFQSLEGIYESLEEVSGPKLRENLLAYKEQAYLSRKLGEIVTNVSLDVGLDDLKVRQADEEKLRKIYNEYELNTLLRRLGQPTEQLVHSELSLLPHQWVDETFDFSQLGERVFVLFYEDDHLPRRGQISYVALSDGKNCFFYAVVDRLPASMISLLESSSAIIGHDLKEALVTLKDQGIMPSNVVFDTSLGAYLLDPTRSRYDLGLLSTDFEGKASLTGDDILGKGVKKKRWKDVDKQKLTAYISQEMSILVKIYEPMVEKIKSAGMEKLYYDLELPLMHVLVNMEYAGVGVDTEVLQSLGDQFQEEIKELEERIYDMAGLEFNLNSPKQLGEVLFDKLGLPVIKRTKTGYSTDADVLDKLKDAHPIVNHILRFRTIHKLKSTYIDGLLPLIHPETGRIHSRFAQKVTATGRLSSVDPNLQNIPIRTEEGRLIRKAFCAADGELLIDADYSQIELRILAHMSEDEAMRTSFAANQDIHKTTASQVFHVDPENVTDEMRRRAKAVNFGIVYGISDYGLSQDLDISRAEAKMYIDNYLDHFQGVKKFMENIVKLGEAQGYVETLWHRRRYIPELSSKNFNVRSFGKRVALNAPIQGTAADIIKIAMVRIDKRLKQEQLDAQIVLQVHDELIIEAKQDVLDQVKQVVREEMENAIQLSVPLVVDFGVGENWYEAK